MGTMDDILRLDSAPPPIAVELVEIGPFQLALLPGGRVIWWLPAATDATARVYLEEHGQVVVQTDDPSVMHRRAAEEAGML